MNKKPQNTFDESQLALRQRRAAKRFALNKDKSPDFLIDYVAEDIGLRLEAVNREFKNALDLFGRTGAIASTLAANPNISKVTRLEAKNFHTENSRAATRFGELELLQLGSEETDLIVSAFALHWSNDLPGTLVQINRALRPDGLFLGLLPGPETLIELRSSFAHTESEIFGGNSPRVDPFISVQSAGSLLQRAGFSLPVIDTDKVIVRYDTVTELMHDLRAMGATNVLEEREKHKFSRNLFEEVSNYYASNFADEDGRIRATFEFISMSGWAPHQNQPKPLKPGSAKVHLGEALKNSRPE